MTFDFTRAREETPGCLRVAHLNNAGSALPPARVTDAMIDYLRVEARMGGYEAADAHASRVEGTYDAIAALIGAHRDEIAVVENATRAWDMAFYAFDFKPGDKILTGRNEYASNAIAHLQVAARTGAVIEVVEDDEHGQLDLDDLRSRVDERVKLISVTHIPTQGGLINPAAEIGKIAREAEIPYLLDACQSIGQLNLDVEEIGCDILSATGRKFLRGPRGTGFLYVRRALIEKLEPPFLDLHSAVWTAPDAYEIRADARRFENWETNYAAKIGLGVAVAYAAEWGMDAVEERVLMLGEALRHLLNTHDGVTVHDLGQRKGGIVTFAVDGVPADEVKERLSLAGVNTSVSRASSAQYDMPGRGLEELVRASAHYYNTEEELGRLVEALPKPRR